MKREADARGGTVATIEHAVAALGDDVLTQTAVQAHLVPLFSRVLERRATAIDLANHSLGRPLDATAADIAEAVSLWQQRLGDAWDAWLDEMRAHRARFARLLGAPRDDCIVPKTNAGQGLRAVLNSYNTVPRVVANITSSSPQLSSFSGSGMTVATSSPCSPSPAPDLS